MIYDICQPLPSDPFGDFKWPFQGLSDLQLGYQKVTGKNLVYFTYLEDPGICIYIIYISYDFFKNLKFSFSISPTKKNYPKECLAVKQPFNQWST